jgi:hypothetical protein
MEKEALTARIKKLFALSSSDFEAEARAALLKAQELMEEHGISMAQVDSVSTDRDEFSTIAEGAVDKGSKTIASWQKRLARVVAENFRCRIFFRSYRTYERDIIVYGLNQDVEVARQVINFALLSARNSWQKYKKARERREGKMPSRAHTEALKNDYMRAFTQGVKEAFEKQVREKAIVLTLDPRVPKYAKEKLNLTVEGGRSQSTLRDADAHASGYQDGLRIRGGDKLANSRLQITE